MSGYVTQTRVHPYQLNSTFRSRTGAYGINAVLSYPAQLQTTTSYRSGGGFGPKATDDPYELFKQQAHSYYQPYDTGHEFKTTRFRLGLSHKEVFLRGTSSYPLAFYRGPLRLAVSGYSGFPVIPDRDLVVYGTTAIKATKPDKPAASLSISLIELVKEGIPALIGFAAYQKGTKQYGPGNVSNKAGGEWLNYQFGILPLVAAVQDLANAVKNSDKIIRQYIRDSGRQVRRSMDFPPIITTYTTQTGNTSTSVPSSNIGSIDTDLGFMNGGGLWSYSVERRMHERIWFSGAYMYYLDKVGNDPFDDLDRYSKLADKLLGSAITADVLYSVTPWSWLLDWFYNFGDIISNAVSFNQNGVLLRYGYVMRETVRTNEVTSKDLVWNGKNFGPVSTSYTTVQKERIKGTPYGFGVNPNSLNTSQISILAALGLTLGSNKLR